MWCVPDSESAFEAVVIRLTRHPGTDLATTFRSPGVRLNGKIVAMHVRGELVVKLPADRCAELVASGAGRPFQTGRRVMREWVTIEGVDEATWVAYAEEALAFAQAASG
jgi:hypothetical protein